jgi:hypothetical protein
MRALRKSIIPAIIATVAIGAGALTLSPQKRVATHDTEIRLMAMLYVSATMPN